MVLLLPAVYGCENGHAVLYTDPYILKQFPEEEFIPFILFHRSGIMREFASSKQLSTSEFISIDHTFQVTANLGYLRPDGKWISTILVK